MASCSFSHGEVFRRDVLIFAGPEPHYCTVLLDADSATAETQPIQITGLLEVPRGERAELANSDLLTLKFRENGEPYRLLLDDSNGRFLARKL